MESVVVPTTAKRTSVERAPGRVVKEEPPARVRGLNDW
jgi:hypothetical protein